jgi:hypothetical protein
MTGPSYYTSFEIYAQRNGAGVFAVLLFNFVLSLEMYMWHCI